MAQFPAVIDLASLDGVDGFAVWNSDQTVHAVGLTVSAADDVNGDGLADFLVNGYVVFGRSEGFPALLDLSALDGQSGFRFGTSTVFASTGLGDVNGDGVADMMFGNAVVFGSSTGSSATTSAELNGANGFTVTYPLNEHLGDAVSGAGDVNGDGFADVMIGAPWARPYYGGATYVVFGKADGFAPSIDLSTLNGSNGFAIRNHTGSYDSGATISAADINDDGFSDLIIGDAARPPQTNWQYPQTFVIFGSASGFPASIDLDQVNGSNGFELTEGQASSDGHNAVSGAGDVNGDGIQDLVVASSSARPASDGFAYVMFGKSEGFSSVIDATQFNGGNGFRIEGAHGDYIGSAVSSAGDVNGDGFDDVLIGASEHSTAYVIFGHSGPFAANISVTDLDGSNGFMVDGSGLTGVLSGGAGSAVSTAGDLNHDGLDDLLVGAPSTGGDDNGSAFVIYGQLPNDSVHRVGTVASQHLVGGDFDDFLNGKLGEDQLWGHDGHDSLLGAAGKDTLIGGAGGDMLKGGGGKDVFLFQALSDSTNADPDVIQDLGRDRINLQAIDADATQDGDQAFTIVSGFTGHAGELAVAYHTTGQNAGYTTVKADVDGDGLADMTIRVVGDHHEFSNFAL